jgi:anti-sigma B factor antagonist
MAAREEHLVANQETFRGGDQGLSEAASVSPQTLVGEAIQLDVELEQLAGNVCVIAVEGELDLYTGPVLERALTQALADGSGSVIVDLTQCSLIDSNGLGILVKANNRLTRRGDPRIAVACPDPIMRKIFEITALHRFLVLHSTLASALECARS